MSTPSRFAKPTWTPAKDAQLLEMIQSGESAASIATQIKRSEKAVHGCAARFGLKAKR
jgi:sulfur transfer protein SufE